MNSSTHTSIRQSTSSRQLLRLQLSSSSTRGHRLAAGASFDLCNSNRICSIILFNGDPLSSLATLCWTPYCPPMHFTLLTTRSIPHHHIEHNNNPTTASQTSRRRRIINDDEDPIDNAPHSPPPVQWIIAICLLQCRQFSAESDLKHVWRK